MFWQLTAANDTPVWMEYVPSDLNVADRPSRARPGIEKPMTANATNRGAPSQFRAMLSSLGALNKAKLTPPPVETDFLLPCGGCSTMETSPDEVVYLEFIYGRTVRVIAPFEKSKTTSVPKSGDVCQENASKLEPCL